MIQLLLLFLLFSTPALAKQKVDPFVNQMEFMFRVQPGQMIPADPRFPEVRLQYLRSWSVGNNDYLIKIHRFK